MLTRQGRDRKAHLLEQAEHLFVERGYADTRTADIATAAGVAKGLVYWYFDGKEALFREIIQGVRDQLRTAQAAALVGIELPLDRICVGTQTSVEHVARHWQVYVELRSVHPSFEREIRESSRVHAGDTLSLVAAGQADGTIRADETPAVLALATQGVTTQAAVAFVRGDVLPLAAAASSAARFVVRGMAASGAIAEEVISRNALG